MIIFKIKWLLQKNYVSQSANPKDFIMATKLWIVRVKSTCLNPILSYMFYLKTRVTFITCGNHFRKPNCNDKMIPVIGRGRKPYRISLSFMCLRNQNKFIQITRQSNQSFCFLPLIIIPFNRKEIKYQNIIRNICLIILNPKPINIWRTH